MSRASEWVMERWAGSLDLDVGKCDIRCHDIERRRRNDGTGLALLPVAGACACACSTSDFANKYDSQYKDRFDNWHDG